MSITGGLESVVSWKADALTYSQRFDSCPKRGDRRLATVCPFLRDVEVDGAQADSPSHSHYQQIMHGQTVHCEQPFKVGATGRPTTSSTSRFFALISSCISSISFSRSASDALPLSILVAIVRSPLPKFPLGDAIIGALNG